MDTHVQTPPSREPGSDLPRCDDASSDRKTGGWRRLLSGNRVSREEETALLRGFFGDSREGRYVDVGANDPFAGSTSWILEEIGWTGVLVEPIPALAERLREHRSGRVFPCACSGPENAGKRLTLSVHPENPGWSTFHRESSPWFRDDAIEIEVEVRTLDSVLEESGIPEGFELLAMDVEFHELEVLAGFDLTRWRPQLLFIEDHVYDHRLLRHLRANDYRCYRRTGLNSWFVPLDSPHRSSLWMRWGVVRKYHLAFPLRRIKLWYKGLLR